LRAGAITRLTLLLARAPGLCGAGRRYSCLVPRRYHLTTFGCQMNEHDSERMKGMLDSLGYQEASERHDAELILFNTCSIREAADAASSPISARPSG
jgi:hypothetical protein